MRFYLDDDVYSERILAACRQLGLWVTGATEAGYAGSEDSAHLAHAAILGCCIVTRNYRDFVRHTRDFEAKGLPHAGVLLLPRSLPNQDFGGIARALKAFADDHPDGMPPYMVDYLQPVD